jgi:hypothetical protein
VRAWLARFAGCDDVAFAVEGCAGWRYVAEELAAAGIAAHLGEPAGTAALRGRKRHAKTGKTHARTPAPGHRYYATVKDRKNSKRAALPEARKIVRQACHILTELGDDALTAA